MPRTGAACHGLGAAAAAFPAFRLRAGGPKGLPNVRLRSQDGRMTRSSSLRSSLFWPALLVVGALVALAPAARADVWSALKGKIFVSDTEFGTGYPTDAAMISAVKKQSKVVIKGEGAWTINLAVFLKEAAGANKINIVYYDLSAKHEQVNFSEVDVKPDQKMVELNGIALSTDLGFVKGHKYDVLATRLIGGKEKVYAKATMTLK
jgi:hypothetical protein